MYSSCNYSDRAAGICHGQMFHSDETLADPFPENRRKMAIVEAQAREYYRQQAALKREIARESEHQRIQKLAMEELDQQSLDNINWFRRQRGQPPIELGQPVFECGM